MPTCQRVTGSAATLDGIPARRHGHELPIANRHGHRHAVLCGMGATWIVRRPGLDPILACAGCLSTVALTSIDVAGGTVTVQAVTDADCPVGVS